MLKNSFKCCTHVKPYFKTLNKTKIENKKSDLFLKNLIYNRNTWTKTIVGGRHLFRPGTIDEK